MTVPELTIADSGDLLVAAQAVRRRHPSSTPVMDLLIDLLCEGAVNEAVDDTLRRWGKRSVAA